MEGMASEIYVTDGIMSGSKYTLIVMEDGSVEFNWYINNVKIPQKDTILVKCGNGIKIEYGSKVGNDKFLMTLYNCEDGKLHKRWEKIK